MKNVASAHVCWDRAILQYSGRGNRKLNRNSRHSSVTHRSRRIHGAAAGKGSQKAEDHRRRISRIMLRNPPACDIMHMNISFHAL